MRGGRFTPAAVSFLEALRGALMSRSPAITAMPPPRNPWDAINPVRLLGELSETRYWMYLLLLPSALLITAIVLFPTVYGFQLSFTEMRLNRPAGNGAFVAFKHY